MKHAALLAVGVSVFGITLFGPAYAEQGSISAAIGARQQRAAIAIQTVTSSDWPTGQHDPQRSGNAAAESVISPANVNTLKLSWSLVVDGKVTAQPLFLGAVQVAGSTHDVVIVATNANSIYALDAATGAQLWRRNFGAPLPGSGAIPGGFGISATPVADRVSGRIYAISDNGKLRTIALATGADVTTPVPVITAHAITNKVWGGLNLNGTNLYVASASDGNDDNPWRGRLFRIDVSQTPPVVATTFVVVPSIKAPNGGGGIWGWGGVSVDAATGDVYAATGADSPPWSSTVPEGYAPYADRMIALDPTLALLGTWKAPHPKVCVGDGGICDYDFGATPVVYQPPGCPTLLAAVNKNGFIYVVSEATLAASGQPLQALALNNAYDGPGSGGLTGVPAYWSAGNMLFVTDAGPGINGIKAGVIGLTVNPAPACTLQVAWSDALPVAGGSQPNSAPTVANGVVFVGEGGDGGLTHAFDALSGTELWNSGSSINGGATFAAPTVANGAVYIGTWNGFGGGDAGTVYAFKPGGAPR